MTEKLPKILCNKLTPTEHDKVTALESLIVDRLPGVQVCEGIGLGDDRFLRFYGLSGLIGSVHADTFLEASARDAVELIAVTTW